MNNKLNYIAFIVYILIIITSCNEDSILEKGVYYSIQKGNYLHSSIFYNFKEDSLFVYNSATNQKLKFKIEYSGNHLVLNNNRLNDYRVEIIEDKNSYRLLDESNYVSFNDTIKLNKITIGSINNKTIKNRFWVTKFKEQDSIWFYFNNKNKLDYYYKSNEEKKYNLLKTEYTIVDLDDNILVIDIPYLERNLLLTASDNEKMTFFLPSSEDLSEFNAQVKYFDNSKDSVLFYATWSKIEFENELDLPNKLSINKDKIILGEREMGYRLGLYNKYLFLKDNSYLQIDKLTKDTLLISIENSIHEFETALYINSKKLNN